MLVASRLRILRTSKPPARVACAVGFVFIFFSAVANKHVQNRASAERIRRTEQRAVEARVQQRKAVALGGPKRGVLPGEFEHQEALLLCWSSTLKTSQLKVLANVVAATWKHIDIAIMVRDQHSREQAAEMLQVMNVPADGVRYIRSSADRVWIRDFGPLAVNTTSGACAYIDGDYVNTLIRPFPGDDVPSLLASTFRITRIEMPLIVEGGALVGNGAGLIVTTDHLPRRNFIYGFDYNKTKKVLREYLGADQVVYLEQPNDETTGHVDMFVTFTAPDTVVVGQYNAEGENEPDVDTLERNAQLLAAVTTDIGPLRVARVPMPPNTGGYWRTYTNVAFANGVLLVPTYGQLDPEGATAAINTFRELMPDWKVVGIDCEPLIKHGGALHCATLNVVRLTNRTPDNYCSKPTHHRL